MAGRTALATREILERLSRRPRARNALGREEKSVQGTSGAPSLIVGLGATGVSVARFLAAHPKVASVCYPGLETFPQHDLARRQATGFGAMVWFEAKGGLSASETAAIDKIKAALGTPT